MCVGSDTYRQGQKQTQGEPAAALTAALFTVCESALETVEAVPGTPIPLLEITSHILMTRL